MKTIYLASSSPRRKELLETIGLPFSILVGDVDETMEESISPYDRAKALAERKAYAIIDQVPNDSIVIGADTIVTYMGLILQKPHNRADAIKMLQALQGKEHTVYTGLTLLFKDENGQVEESTCVNSTDVTMHSLTEEEIEAYANTGESLDKAGAYGIQGKGSVLIESIHGDYYTVMGLPIPQLYLMLRKHGVDLTNYWKNKGA